MHKALQALYESDFAARPAVGLKDEDKFKPELKKGLFQRLTEWIHRNKGFNPEHLDDPEPYEMIKDTYRVISKPLHDIAVRQEVSPELTSALEQNAFMFSGFKIFHESNEMASMLKGDDGGFKSYDRFEQDVLAIDESYNHNYLRAEYNFAANSTLSAVRWQNYVKDDDRYNLQYRTALDERVRKEHQMLEGITLPPSDKFWDKYYPPNGWNCRCTVVQVLKDKYPTSNSDQACASGERATTQIGKDGSNKAAIFRFNPGKSMKVFPPKHPYFPKGCGNCSYKRLIFDNEKAICKACRSTDAAIVKWSRDVVREHYEKVAKNDITLEIGNTHLDKLTFSVKDIKNITGKPHDYPYARNMATYYLKHIAQKSDYLGYSDDIKPDNPKHTGIVAWRYYSFDFLGSKSILIVKEYEDGTLRPHHIQDSNHFKKDKIKYPFK